MIYKRELQETILKALVPNKVIVLLGARRIGKTILLGQIIEQLNEECLLLNGEDFSVQEVLQRRSVQNYKNLLGNKRLLVIDEAQKIPEIGQILKLIVDSVDGIRIIATGSSAFDLEKYTGEPLTGRKKTFFLFPLSETEFNQSENIFEKKDNLRQRLIYGNYPEISQIDDMTEKGLYLKEILHSYLLKDILAFENIQNTDKIFNLLRLVAFQVGSEVSNQELARQLSMSKNTIGKYLDLLSKVFVLHKVGGFSRNLRKEITKNNKWYFYDNGIRNILIANLNPVEGRNDIGQLWENYVISERLKFQNYSKIIVNNYFWRTYDQQEIDWVEESGGKLTGFEFKWNEKQKKKTKIPKSWTENYKEAEFEIITPQNYMEWITK
jgi:hypothetical protein